jgi:CDP-4-dehydro-6-deoxyglucose reductase, E1
MIPLMKNAFLDEHETKRLLADFILKSDRLSMDQKCFEFEREFAKYQCRKDAILFNSGGSANLALLQALKNMGQLKNGDNVGFSALTWSTNVMPIIQMGLEPVPVDCKIETLNVMSDNLEKTLKTTPLRALFITNVLGFCGDLDRIRSLCKERNILLLEDNCESLGSELPQGKAGNFSLGSTFSFFVAHHMSTIEGGMLCTDDDDLGEMLRIVRANGWDRNLTASQQKNWRKKYDIRSEFQAKYTFYDLGFNLRPTEITGFLGLNQLKHLDSNIAIREKNYTRLEAVIKKNDELIPLDRSHLKFFSSFAVPVVAKTPALREKYLSLFAGAGVEIRPMIAGNMQRQPFYKKYVGKEYALPNTDFIHECGLYCGNYPELTNSDLEILQSCLSHY